MPPPPDSQKATRQMQAANGDVQFRIAIKADVTGRPGYARRVGSNSSMISIARTFGAPMIDPGRCPTTIQTS